jgi:RNA polymerase sigma factor (TIGR02999 family)
MSSTEKISISPADGGPGDITRLLNSWQAGDAEASARVMPLVYGDLRRIAAGYARRERQDPTLQATAIVHEAYLRLFGAATVEWQSRAHFLGIAARIMRQILVDHSRARTAKKRTAKKRGLPGDIEISQERTPDLVAVDDALKSLAKIDPLESRLVELRFFAGLSIEETAECLGVSRKTVVRRWRRAKAWLYAELER